MDGTPGIVPLYPSGPMQVKPADTQITQFAGHTTFDDRGRQEYVEVDPQVYRNIWQQTLDVWFPVQMDHMFVNEAYRVWHGAAHLDDARQAPVNTQHFDGYRMGASTETPYEPGEHIPGLNVGGWFDAGDYDIRAGSHASTIMHFVDTWERFKPAGSTS